MRAETMSYFTPIAIMILVVSPVLIPLVITGVHAISNWRRQPERLRPVINPERRTADLVST
jgi:hypothetical protein